jgi:hypothetical protein
MSVITDDMQTLVRQTFEMTSQNDQLDAFGEFELPVVAPNSIFALKGIKGPGVIFKVEKGPSTICIRVLPAENLEQSSQQLIDKNQDYLRVLKVDNNDELQSLKFFETSSYRWGVVIQQQLANQRFPIEEDRFCNISDPGFSWWMEKGTDWFRIHFKNICFSERSKVVKLGPLGELFDSKSSLLEFSEYIKGLFPMDEFVCSERHLSVHSHPQFLSQFFELKNLFLRGEMPYIENRENEKIIEMFTQICVLRKFWSQIESDIV